MINKQIYHATKDKSYSKQFTAAVLVPDKENLRIDVWKLLGENIKTVKYPVGIAKVSPKDRYNRKTGRELALSRMEDQELQLVEVLVNHGKKTIVLSNESVMIVLEMKEGRDKIHLIEVNIA